MISFKSILYDFFQKFSRTKYSQEHHKNHLTKKTKILHAPTPHKLLSYVLGRSWPHHKILFFLNEIPRLLRGERTLWSGNVTFRQQYFLLPCNCPVNSNFSSVVCIYKMFLIVHSLILIDNALFPLSKLLQLKKCFSLFPWQLLSAKQIYPSQTSSTSIETILE